MEDVSVKRLSIVALICFFPLAIIGMARSKKDPQAAIKLYQACLYIAIVFFLFLAMYVYQQGGNFVKPMGTFY